MQKPSLKKVNLIPITITKSTTYGGYEESCVQHDKVFIAAVYVP